MRNRYFDLLRATAIGRVVLYHTLGLWWLTVVFPAMGLMFALGGCLMAASLDRSGIAAVGRRLRRVLLPLWVLSAAAIGGMLLTGYALDLKLLLWIFPLFHPPTNEWGGQWLGMIWYVREYLWFVLLSPVMLWCFRRRPILAIGLPFAGLLFLSLSGLRADPVIADFCLYAPAWMLGFAQHDGMLARLARRTLWLVAGMLAVAGLAWLFTHPGPRGFDLNDVPLANGLWSTGFLLVLLAIVKIPVGRSDLLEVINRRALTVYLWHQAAIAIVGTLAVSTGISLLGWSGGLIEVSAVLLLVTVFVALFGWVEDVAAKREPGVWPVTPRPLAAGVALPYELGDTVSRAQPVLPLSVPRMF